MDLIIDRFEGDIAVCEAPDGTHTDIPREKLPAGAAEGSVIAVSDDGSFMLDTAETESRRKRLAGLLNDLMKR